MLGSVRGDYENWMWGAFGKHPVAKDYFSIGPNSPIIRAFSDWVEKGYRHLVSNEQGDQAPCSWRFWVKGGGKDALSCGLLKDSSDRVGRRYPFLMMGTGVIKGRHHHWHLLPITFDQTWSQMEFLSTRRFSTFQELEEAVLEGRAPSADWSEMESHVEHMTDLVQSQVKSVLDAYAAHDLPAAMTVWKGDEEVDAICTSLFRELLTYMMEDPRNIGFCIHLMFCAKNIERIGDHATNVAETVFYMIEGQPILDKRPKGDMTTFATTAPGN